MTKPLLLIGCFLSLLLIAGCDDRPTVDNASILCYDYPQLGLRVSLWYDPWKHREHFLEYVTIDSNDHGCDHTAISLISANAVIYRHPTLRTLWEHDPAWTNDPMVHWKESPTDPFWMRSWDDVQAPLRDGYRHHLSIGGKPVLMRLETSQGTVSIDFHALKSAHLQSMGTPTWFGQPYRHKPICF